MILTVTPNTAIDRVMFVRGFRLGRKVGATAEAYAPAGKGVGASLTTNELGGETLASGLAAGHAGRRLRQMLDAMGIAHDFVEAEGETRISIVLVDLDSHRQSTISVPTLHARATHVSNLRRLLRRYATDVWGVVFGGSLPQGMNVDAYASLIRDARQLGLFVLLDTSGNALRVGIAGQPHILKVNQNEIGVLAPQIARDLSDVAIDPLCVGSALRDRIGSWALDAVIVTMGHRGTLAVTAQTTITARPPEVPIVNTAGAGDALTGGVMLSRSQGHSWTDALALGTAAAASVVMNEGTGICRREQVAALLPQVVIED